MPKNNSNKKITPPEMSATLKNKLKKLGILEDLKDIYQNLATNVPTTDTELIKQLEALLKKSNISQDTKNKTRSILAKLKNNNKNK